jgi:hypothetical protein
MVSIEDCSSKHPLPQLFKGDGRLPEDSKSSGTDQNTGRENQIPIILAKAAVAAKMQIVSGMGNRDKEPQRHEVLSGSTQDSSGLSIKQGEGHEEDMVRNLKVIVSDDSRWDLFALGALGLQPGSQSCETLRDGLQKGFKEDTWGSFANLVALYSEGKSTDEKNSTSVPADELSTGLIERTKLWLTFSTYFENLFSAVREKNLPYNLDLYTDERLIKYLHTIGQ